MTEEGKIEQLARLLCKEDRRNPDGLEPGNRIIAPWMDEAKFANAQYDHLFDSLEIQPDGHHRNGDPCHFNWREYIWKAQRVLALVKQWQP